MIIKKKFMLLSLVCYLSAGFSAQALYSDYKTYKVNSQSYEELEELKTVNLVSGDLANKSNILTSNADSIINETNGNVNLTDTPEPNPSFEEQFDKFKVLNSDYVGWLGIPGTSIDYPVVKTNNNDYYLKNDFYRNANQNGCLFIDCNVSNPFRDSVTVIHGHHMRDGSMFGNLSLYKNEQYYRNHRTIMFLERDRLLTYEVFSVFYEPVNPENYQFKFGSKGEYVEHLNKFQDKSIYRTEVTPFQPSDRILILSTCSYESEDNRLLIVARLIK